jgi:hypothetical protein
MKELMLNNDHTAQQFYVKSVIIDATFEANIQSIHKATEGITAVTFNNPSIY